MKNKPQITWKALFSKVGGLLLSVLALLIKIIRKAGEGAGESVAESFIKDSDTQAEKNRKVSIGKKTGSLISSLLTLGIVGSYIMEVSDTLDDNNENEKNAVKPTTQAEADISKDTAIPIDLNDDGRADGFDTNNDGKIDVGLDSTHGKDLNGDGIIDVNHKGEVIGDIEYIGEHIRTVADGNPNNNIS